MKVKLHCLLTAITGKIFGDFSEYRGFMNEFIDDDLLEFESVSPDLLRQVRPALIKQLPFLAKIDGSHINTSNALMALGEWTEEFGSEFELEPIGKVDFEPYIPEALLSKLVTIVHD